MTNYQVPQNAMLKFRYIGLFIDLLLHILTSPLQSRQVVTYLYNVEATVRMKRNWL